MNELENLKQELQEINNRRIRLETIIEQAKQQCLEIEQKYSIKNEEELKDLLDRAETMYKDSLAKAYCYLADTKLALSTYEGMI